MGAPSAQPQVAKRRPLVAHFECGPQVVATLAHRPELKKD